MGSLLAVILAAAPLSFEQALSLAEQAPLVSAASRAAEVSRSTAATVSPLQQNPTVGFQPGVRNNVNGTGPELFASLSQSFNVAGYGAARKEALEQETALELQTHRLQAHRARLTTADAWLQVWSAQGVLAEARRELEVANDLGARFERAAKSGGVTRADAATVRAWVAEAQLAVLTAEGQLFDTGVHLNRVLGVEANGPAVVSASLPALALEETALQQSVERSEHAPLAGFYAQTKDAEQARLAENKASNGTWVQAGVMGGREGLGDVLVMGTVAVTLPTFNLGEREAAPLKSAIAHAEGQRVAAVADARAERVQALHELEHTKETLDVVEQQLVPANEEAAQGIQRRMEGGESTAQEWLLARRALLAARSRLVVARANHALARFRAIELARVTGETKR